MGRSLPARPEGGTGPVPGRLDTLTALRGVAALLVFTRHASEFVFFRAGSPLAQQGATGVSFFFVLSGFVLAWSARPGEPKRRFWRRRFARIYPAYIVVLCLTVGTEAIRHKDSFLAFGLNAALVQSWVPDASIYFAAGMGAWSLGCEMFFYLCFPLVLPRLLALPPRRRWQVAAGAAGLELMMALVSHSHNQAAGVGLWLVYVLPATRLGEFVIGMVLALAVRDGLRPRVTLPQALILALAAYILAGLAPAYLMWVLVTLAPFCLVIVTAAVSDVDRRPTRWRSGWLVRFGRWSYAFYLIHISVVAVIGRLIGPRAGLAEQTAATVAALALAVAGSGLLYTFVERPAETLLRGGSRKLRRDAGSGPAAGEILCDPDGYRRTQPPPSQIDLGGLHPGGGGGRSRADRGDVGAATEPGAPVGHPEAHPLHRAVLQRLRLAAPFGGPGPHLRGSLHRGAPPREGRPRRGHRFSRLRTRPAAARPAGADLRAGPAGAGGGPVHAPHRAHDLLPGHQPPGRPAPHLEGAGHLNRAAVLIVVHYFAPHIGGMEEVSRAQATSLSRRGHPVTVVTCAHTGGLPRRDRSHGFELHRIRALNFLERRFGITFPLVGPLGALRIARQVRRAGIVHIHDVFYPSSHVAAAAARLLRRPYHLTQHVAMVEHPSRLVTGAQRFVYATVGGAALRGAASVIVYNARVRDFVVGLGVPADRVVVNHNGIDTDLHAPLPDPAARAALRARYGLPADRPVVLFVGRLVPKKGYDLVMAAARDGWTTLIVGEGAGSPPSPPAGVVLFGAAGREQLVDLYRLSDVFVFPAVGEIFTLVMQEAMASGLPVVTTDDPAYAEYGLDRNRMGFVARHAAAIGDEVGAILASPARAAAMAAYSRALAVERFSWEANYHVEYSVYRGAGAEPSRSGTHGQPEVRVVPSPAG